jgi:hypothetical protein
MMYLIVIYAAKLRVLDISVFARMLYVMYPSRINSTCRVHLQGISSHNLCYVSGQD